MGMNLAVVIDFLAGQSLSEVKAVLPVSFYKGKSFHKNHIKDNVMSPTKKLDK